jgi:glycosyltransferase involved in cell wall biosynthesis
MKMGNENRLEISIVIPVYNEVESLEILHSKLSEVLTRLGRSYEIVFVDDGSRDGSLDVLHQLHLSDPNVVVVEQRRNFGKSQALAAGFALSRGAVVITMDGDLQDEPEEIPRLLSRLEEGYDLVAAWRKDRHDRLTKQITSWIANTATNLFTGVRFHDMNCGFKAYRRECVEKLHLYGDMHRYIPILAVFAGFRVTEVPVVHHERRFGRSKYGMGRLYRGGLDLITVIFLNSYQRRPLHLFGGMGILLFLMGFVILLVLTIQWLAGMTALSERPLLFLGVLLVVVGVQLFTSGLFAELIVENNQRYRDPLDTVGRILRKDDVGTMNPSQHTEQSE